MITSPLLLVPAALLGLVVLVVLIGFALPERYTGKAKRTLEAPPSEVWSALADYEHHPMTGKMARRFEALPERDGLAAWKEDMGRGEVITVTTTESREPEYQVREMSASAVPMSSRWEYRLQPAEGGCQVNIDAVTNIRRGTWHVPIFRVMMIVGGGVQKGLEIQLDMLEQTISRS